MAKRESMPKKTQRAMGLTAPGVSQPPGSALAAALVAGAIVGAILWIWRGPVLAAFVFGLALLQGLFREIVRSRQARELATKPKKRKR